jgi:hypothetical protein
VGKPEGKRPLGRLRRRWVENSRMELGEVGWGKLTAQLVVSRIVLSFIELVS